MIAINELRVGNYVKEDGLEEQHTIICISEILNGLVGQTKDRRFLALNRIHGIPLTEDIVLANFKMVRKVLSFQFWSNGNFNIKSCNSNPNDFYLEGYKHPVIIKYVHQLQNLYFALIGEELNIKL